MLKTINLQLSTFILTQALSISDGSSHQEGNNLAEINDSHENLDFLNKTADDNTSTFKCFDWISVQDYDLEGGCDLQGSRYDGWKEIFDTSERTISHLREIAEAEEYDGFVIYTDPNPTWNNIVWFKKCNETGK